MMLCRVYIYHFLYLTFRLFLQAWGDAERAAWLVRANVLRRGPTAYRDEVLAKVEALKATFDVEQYGALSQDPARYPLFAIKTRNWDAAKPYVLITGGVHGYETSGVQGALLFMQTKAVDYSRQFNIVCCPCVSPWAYECIQRWTNKAIDPNRMFFAEGVAEESTAARRPTYFYPRFASRLVGAVRNFVLL